MKPSTHTFMQTNASKVTYGCIYVARSAVENAIASGQERRGMLKNRVSIDDHPQGVDLKERIGDWEG